MKEDYCSCSLNTKIDSVMSRFQVLAPLERELVRNLIIHSEDLLIVMIMIIFAGEIVCSGTLLLMGNVLCDCSGRQDKFVVSFRCNFVFRFY